MADSTQSVEITSVVVKSETESSGSKTASSIGSISSDSDIFILIDGDDRIYTPYICDDVKVTRERTGAPSKMTFSCVDIEGMNISMGNAVAFIFKNEKIFYGYIFSSERDSDGEKINITCYDQLRYFKNKDSFVYNMKYSDMLKKKICSKYGLKTGTIEDTGYVIPTKVADGSLFEICANASRCTILSNGTTYVLYDDFGAICLCSLENMMLPLLIDKDVSGKWQIKETIDSDVYNRVVVRKDNSETGERELYIVNDSETQKKWGILTLVEDADENSTSLECISTAKSKLKYYNRTNKSFSVDNCIGYAPVRGGSSFIVHFNLPNGEKIQNLMIVEKVEHTFSENSHFMDLKLYGGDYIA